MAGGETGAIIQSIDWSKHDLGVPSQWPQSLKTALSIVLHSKFPMFLWWGPGLTCFYNDAYRPSLGENGKHPSIMGMKAQDAWPEIWDTIKPLIDQVLGGEGATWSEDQLIPIFRNGKIEDVYWTFSYSPVMDETGKIAGVLVTCNETTEKINILRSLKESKGDLAFAIEAAGLATWDYNPITNTFKGDGRLREWFGISCSANIELADIIRPVAEKDKKMVSDSIKHALDYTSGGRYEIEYSIINPSSKKEIILRAKGRAWFNEQKIAYRFNGILEDVTDEVTARRKSTEDGIRFKELVLQAPMGITVLMGPALVAEIANDKYLELIGRSREQFEGKSLFESVPELKGQAVEMLLSQVLETGKPYFGNEFKAVIYRNGKKEDCYFNFVYKPIFDEGKTTGIMVVAMEVTELVIAKYALQESEAGFRKMVMQSPIPMTIWRGKDFIIEKANYAMFNDIWRKEEHEVIGKKALDVFPELIDQKYPELLKYVMETGVAHNERESIAYVHGADGMRKFYLDFEYAPLTEVDGSISGILITVNDVTEKVEARESLRESENYFRRMADSVPTMIWITNRDGLCTYVNKQWHAYTGQAFEDSLRHGWLSAIHPDDREHSFGLFEESTKQNIGFTLEYRLKNVEGIYKWAFVEALPRFDSHGQFDGYIGTVTDIDDRKKIQEQIKESEERTRLAIEAAELGTYEWTVGTDYIHASQRLMDIFARDWTSTVDRLLLVEMIHPDDRQLHKEAHAHALETGVLSYEARIIRDDNSIRWIKNQGKVVYGTNKMLGTVMDITELKNIESALKISEARLSEAQRIASIGNWEYNHLTKNFYCSDEVYRILSTTPETFVPSFGNLFHIIHPGDIRRLTRTLASTRKTGEPFDIDFRIITAENKIKHINSQGYVVFDEHQKFVKIIGTLQDISIRKLVEEELREAKMISEKSLKYKEQFLANMSHEIRTPMNAIVGFTELVLKTPLYPEQKQYIDAIKTSGENLLVIINDILDFSKIDAGAIHFEQIDFKLSEVISTLTDLMLPKSVEKGIKLSVALNPNVPNGLVGDPTRLNQILLNLVGNAIKFTEKGDIRITAEVNEETNDDVQIRFAVSDTGIGIEPHMTETIFEVFTQSSSDTTRKYGGSGLGLAIVKQFVEKQGGNVWVESQVGKGSTFYFTLRFGKPLSNELPTGTFSKTPDEIFSHPIKILLVEDNKLNQLLASKAMSSWNWQVVVADNGLIALEKLAKEDFDVILMDIQLPEMDGYEATRSIRNSFEAPKCHTPIIAVTAHAMQSEIAKCKEAGMDGYITKPFSPNMLYEGIMKVIDSKPVKAGKH